MKTIQILLISFALTLFSSCVAQIPYTVGAKGKVVDSTSKKAIAEATLQIDGRPKVKTTTARDGSFTLLPENNWVFLWGPLCRNGPLKDTLLIEKDGYHPQELPIVETEEDPLLISLSKKDPNQAMHSTPSRFASGRE